MNRKLFCMLTLVVTVLLTLAFAVPTLAHPLNVENYHWDEVFPAWDCNGDGENEIWIHLDYHWQVRQDDDENGEEYIFHTNQKWLVYNELHPELFIKGVTEATGHLNENNGEWGTGVNNNFHAPGYPQVAHFSGYWTLDEEGNAVLEHGRFTPLDIDLFCELLTPP